jgi:FkbM family methyltransferase
LKPILYTQSANAAGYPGEHSESASLRLASGALRLLRPGLPGKTRAARLMLRSFLQAEDVRVNDRAGFKYVVPSLCEPVAFHLLTDGVYEPETLRLVLKSLGPGSTFVDVGANIGALTIPAARKVGADGRVVAIEASPRVFPYLAHNVAINGISNVCLRCCAASDIESPALPFYEAPPDHFGMGSLGAQFHAKPTAVPGETLDRILAQENITQVSVLKIDVEGFESAVLRGAARLLSSPNPPMVIFEFCDWAEARFPNSKVGDAQRLLRQYGYTLWLLHDFQRGGSTLMEKTLVAGSAMLVAEKLSGAE